VAGTCVLATGAGTSVFPGGGVAGGESGSVARSGTGDAGIDAAGAKCSPESRVVDPRRCLR